MVFSGLYSENELFYTLHDRETLYAPEPPFLAAFEVSNISSGQRASSADQRIENSGPRVDSFIPIYPYFGISVQSLIMHNYQPFFFLK